MLDQLTRTVVPDVTTTARNQPRTAVSHEARDANVVRAVVVDVVDVAVTTTVILPMHERKHTHRPTHTHTHIQIYIIIS